VKIDPLLASLSRAAGAPQLLLFPGDADFGATLALGQIIKGRVLRGYEGQRYLVDFDGQQKIVDSSVPLRTDEIIRGRVVGLGEQVQLQRLGAEPASPSTNEAAPQPGAPALSDKAARTVAELFERYVGKLGAEQWQALQRLVARSPQPDQAALAGLILNKLGLQIAPDFFKAVSATIGRAEEAGLFALPPKAIVLATDSVPADQSSTLALAALLNRFLVDVPEVRFRTPPRAEGEDGQGIDEGLAQDDVDYDLARWILNAQTGGAVAHRIATLPLLVDGELVELDVALFEQSADREPSQQHGLRHREVVLALSTEALGRVEIRAVLAGGHVRVQIIAGDGGTSQFMSTHAERLAAELQEIGWQVDELRYETRAANDANGVVRSLVEHVISPGSVSRLV
jgi:hypothetical protein